VFRMIPWIVAGWVIDAAVLILRLAAWISLLKCFRFATWCVCAATLRLRRLVHG